MQADRKSSTALGSSSFPSTGSRRLDTVERSTTQLAWWVSRERR